MCHFTLIGHLYLGLHIFFHPVAPPHSFPWHTLLAPLCISTPAPSFNPWGSLFLQGSSWDHPGHRVFIPFSEHLYRPSPTAFMKPWNGGEFYCQHVTSMPRPHPRPITPRISQVGLMYEHLLRLTRWFQCVPGTENHYSKVKSQKSPPIYKAVICPRFSGQF